MSNAIANNWLGAVLSAWISGKTLRVILAGATCNIDDEDDNVGDITTLGELSGTGYTGGHAGSGRKELANPTVTVDDPNDQAELDADPITWSSINAGTAKKVIYHVPGTSDDSDAVIIGNVDVDQATNGGDLTWTPNAEGFVKIGRAAGS